MTSLIADAFGVENDPRQTRGVGDIFARRRGEVKGAAKPAPFPAAPSGARRSVDARSEPIPIGKTKTAGFESVVLPHLDAAYNLASWLMGGGEAARDVVQDSMLRALTYFPSFKGGNARGWVLQIVRNAAYASLKKSRIVTHVPIDDDGIDEGWGIADLPDPADDPETFLGRVQEQKLLGRFLADLPVEFRECVILRELEDLSYKEIAEITDTPIGTVMSRLCRARRLLMKMAVGSAASP